jgi:CRP-like cAMP-binding protein
MSECLKKNNLPHHIFILPMMKKDIASFIGISPETTARMIRQLEAIDVIANQGRTLVIKQPEYLYSLLPPGLIGHLT